MSLRFSPSDNRKLNCLHQVYELPRPIDDLVPEYQSHFKQVCEEQWRMLNHTDSIRSIVKKDYAVLTTQMRQEVALDDRQQALDHRRRALEEEQRVLDGYRKQTKATLEAELIRIAQRAIHVRQLDEILQGRRRCIGDNLDIAHASPVILIQYLVRMVSQCLTMFRLLIHYWDPQTAKSSGRANSFLSI